MKVTIELTEKQKKDFAEDVKKYCGSFDYETILETLGEDEILYDCYTDALESLARELLENYS